MANVFHSNADQHLHYDWFLRDLVSHTINGSDAAKRLRAVAAIRFMFGLRAHKTCEFAHI